MAKVSLESDAQNFEKRLLSHCTSFSFTTLSLAGKSINFIGSNESVIGVLKQSGHLQVEADDSETVYLIDFTKTPLDLPFSISEPSGYQPGFNYFFASGYNLALIEFVDSGNRFVLYRQPSQPNTSDVLRLIYQWLVGESVIPIHGGTVSWGSKTALISNVGGSGKSTLISTAVLTGAKTTGDDFGLLQTDDGSNSFNAWSQFQTFKLSPDSPSRPLITSQPLFRANGKDIFSFESVVPGSVVPLQGIDQIVIPILGQGLSVRPASFEDSLKHLAISSSGMALERARTTLKLVEMCRRVPSVILTLSRNSESNALFLRELLS